MNDGTAFGETGEAANSGGGQDDLISVVLPATSVPETAASVVIEAGWTFAANGNNKQAKIIMKGQTLYDTRSVAQNGGILAVRITLIREPSTAAEMLVESIATSGGAIPTTVSIANQASLNFAAAMTTKETGQSHSSVSGDVTQRYLRIRAYPAP